MGVVWGMVGSVKKLTFLMVSNVKKRGRISEVSFLKV